MSTSKEVHDKVMSLLEAACEVGDLFSRKMMGEYLLYYRGKLFGDLCDNRLLIKQTEASCRLLPDAPKQYPYAGSRTLMLLAEHPEDTALMRSLLEQMYPELPEPKKK